MININNLRWLSFFVIVFLISLLELNRHLYYMDLFSMNISHLLNITGISTVVFIVLTFTFNIIDKLNKKILQLNTELKDINKTLEEKVASRTKELKEALDKLKKEHEELIETQIESFF